MFCKNCGKQMNDNCKFCPSCGTPTSAPIAPATSAPFTDQAQTAAPVAPIFTETPAVNGAPLFNEAPTATPEVEESASFAPAAPAFEEPAPSAPLFEERVAPSFPEAPESTAPVFEDAPANSAALFDMPATPIFTEEPKSAESMFAPPTPTANEYNFNNPVPPTPPYGFNNAPVQPAKAEDDVRLYEPAVNAKSPEFATSVAEEKPEKKVPVASYEHKPLSTPVCLGLSLLYLIPVIGLIASMAMAFGATDNQNKKALARTWLIFKLLGIAAIVGVAVLVFAFSNEVLKLANEFFHTNQTSWSALIDYLF